MNFNSQDFLIFLPIVVIVYHLLPKKISYLWLLVASYYFYMCWNARYAILMFVSTLTTYLSGLLINKAQLNRAKKWVVFFSLFINLGILIVFKYYAFASDAITRIANLVNVTVTIPRLDVLLPVGISFYTFQALSYTLDVYRKEIEPEKNFFRYALFVSFFPQLVAGPIERSKNLLTQLRNPKKIEYKDFVQGVFIVIYGFFMKVVLADRIAIYVDTVYSDYTTYTGWYLAVAAVLFAFQIYFDFYGYSSIAIGSAKMLGIDLMENFNAPFLSPNFQSLWNRWHVSLSNWFKDYLYIPLGGSRHGIVRRYINMMIVFILSGLWHGANYNFVIWGALCGIIVVVESIVAPVKRKIAKALGLQIDNISSKVLGAIYSTLMFSLCFIFFRNTSYKDALNIVSSIFSADNLYILFDKESLFTCGLNAENFRLLIAGISIVIAADIFKVKGVKISKVLANQNAWARWIVIALSITAILVFGIWGPGFNPEGFIYFQF